MQDAELGVGIDYVNPIERTKTRCLLKAVMNRKEKKERLGEELRVLYVALTRAKEKLIMTGTVRDAAQYEQELREKLSLYGIAAEKMDGECAPEPRTGSVYGTDATLAAEPQAGSLGRAFVTPLPVGVIREASCMLDWVMAAVYAGNLDGKTVTVSVRDAEQLSVSELQADTAQELRKILLSAKDDEESEWERHSRERFSFSYPYEALRGLYTKTTVSELKIAALEAAGEERESADTIFPETHAKTYIPRFEREEASSGTDRGTAYHKALELMDLSAENTREALEATCACMLFPVRFRADILNS